MCQDIFFVVLHHVEQRQEAHHVQHKQEAQQLASSVSLAIARAPCIQQLSLFSIVEFSMGIGSENSSGGFAVVAASTTGL